MENNRKSAPKKRAQAKKLPRRTLIILSAAAIALLAVAAAVSPYLLRGAPVSASIRIPRGATIGNLRDSLAKYFGESYASKVIRVLPIGDEEIAGRYGMYRIEKGTSPLRAARRLAKWAQEPVRITINGFRSRNDMAARIAARMDFKAEDLLLAMSDSVLLASYGLTADNSPVLFLDDSYDFYWTSTPQEIIKKIGEHYLDFWTKERRAKAASLGLTPAQIGIVASIVDEETLKADEKGRIGRLYINRLHAGMRLQADPTVRFALNDFTIRRVGGEALNVQSPYNTYRVGGLPPGPIRTTSAATIDAILNSKASGDLYMCARPDFSGYHDFAATYAEHQANARRYQEALDRKGLTL